MIYIEKKLSHLYVITNEFNGKKYFGITSQNPATKRWNGHKTVAKRKVRKTPLISAMNKYGFDNFTFKVIVSDESMNFISNLEKEYIQKYNTRNRDFGYNLSIGGEINTGFEIPEEIRKKRSIEMTGVGNHFYGKKHSDESRLKISRANKGRKLSEETRLKMKNREGNLKGVKGKNHPSFGKSKSKSERELIQANMPHKKGLLMLDANTDDIIIAFVSKKEAGRWLYENGKCQSRNERSVVSTINRAIKLNTVSYGYKWREK